MSRNSLRSTINLSRDKQTFESRLTESSSVRASSKNLFNNSNPSSTSSSMANVSISFLKDTNFPKLFNHSPMLFSFNPNPQTTTHSSLRSSLGFSSPLSNGLRTPNSSSYSSLNQLLEKDSFRKKSLFSKKPSELIIDVAKNKNKQEQKLRTAGNSVAKQTKHKINKSQYQSSQISYDSNPKQQSIRVFIRIKPNYNRDLCIKPYVMKLDEKHVEIDGKIMAYDYVFSENCIQQEVFQKVAKAVVSGVFEGYNGTIFAYGQTGSGKTHTIFGQSSNQNYGIIPRSMKYIFNNLKNDSKVSISFLEIYKQELVDLLIDYKTDLKIKQTSTGISIQGLTKRQIKNIEETLVLIEYSLKNRRVAATKLNEKSSRSHTILTIYIQTMQQQSKLCLIDLAGSQKVNKAGVVGQNFQELKKINYSLSCLGNVINALVTRKKSDHIPFRDSKLTRLLKDSLSGRFRTSIIVNCSSDPGTQDQSMSSLKFADRAKKVKITISKCNSKGKQNIQYLHKVIQQLTTDLQNTKRELDKYKQNQKTQTQPKHFESQEHHNQPSKIKVPQSPEITARQTIPSERAHLDQQMKKYGKQNKRINVVSICQKQKKKPSFHLSQLSSLNVSKSTVNLNFFGQIGSPSVSSLSYRPDEAIDDLSFHFSSMKKQDLTIDKNN